VKIGVISDLHGKCDPKIFDILKGTSLILSLGDIEDENIIVDISCIANIVGVRGNMDMGFDPVIFPIERTLKIMDTSIFMAHIIDMSAEKTANVILFGHTHIAENYTDHRGVLHFNPGSATFPREGKRTIGILEIGENGQVGGNYI